MAIFDEEQQCFISSAEVAEIDFVAFTGRRKAEQVACRLVTRRVKRLQPLASDGTVQGELLAAFRHHAFITNSTLSTVEADQRHRDHDHAIIEQVIAELKDGPLAHLPSGSYPANAAWVSLAVIAFNLARAAAVAAGLTTARWATLRRQLINLPGRLANSGRRLVLHLYPQPGRGPPPGSCSGPAPPAPQRPTPPDHPARNGPTRKPKWKTRSRPETQTRPLPVAPDQQDQSPDREAGRWIG